ncbi:conserved exported hypothetical protein [Rhodococcus sp. RD6.2]|uniref:DUF3558 domain-containing protein n=1 Tax=Rhodococcus sp. RD6.2 TaxID=260936 RepID=UPI00063BBC3E|nr:conserved exported hypothetical protein [Rhodococcus sp. RD6.2]
MRAKAVVGVMVCAAALASGCGTVAGEAKPQDPTASQPEFNPCDDLSDDAVRAAGMDPATEAREILGVQQPGWSICEWDGPSYALGVAATNYSLGDVRRNPEFKGFEPVEVPGRSAIRFGSASGGSDDRCYVATPSGSGTVLISATLPVGRPGDPCALALDGTRVLLPYLPE